MPFKNPEKRKANRKKYYEEHREKSILDASEWNKQNRKKRNKMARLRYAVRCKTDPQFSENRRKKIRKRNRTDSEFREYRRIKTRESYNKHQAKRLELAKRYRHTEKAEARKKAYNAVRRGDIVKPKKCQNCGGSIENLSQHHDDYSKPLNIDFLCPFCHGEKRQKH